MRRVFQYLAVVSLCALLSGVAAAQEKQKKEIPKSSAMPGGPSNCDAVDGNLVSNCGFETGMFGPEWTLSGEGFAGVTPPVRHSGNFGAFLGGCPPCATPGPPAFIRQILPTTADQSYDLSFWLGNEGQEIDLNEFQVIWDGVVISDMVDDPDFPYREMDFPGLVASQDGTELTFGFFNLRDSFFFDDVVVVPSCCAPK